METKRIDAANRCDYLVLVADARSAKLLLRGLSGTLTEQWKIYAESHHVNGLNQSPDTREVMAEKVTQETVDFARTAFIADIKERLAEVSNAARSTPIVVIAPKHFVDALKIGFGPTFWTRVKHLVARDETLLHDGALHHLVDLTIGAVSATS